MIVFRIPGQPVAKGRARTARTKTGATIHYTPAKTANYETLVSMAAVQAMDARPPYARDIPLSLRVDVAVRIPTSWSGKKRLAALNGQIVPTTRPDLDNFIKAITDGCTNIVFLDDSAIVGIQATKRYGLRPGVSVEIVHLTSATPAKAEQHAQALLPFSGQGASPGGARRATSRSDRARTRPG